MNHESNALPTPIAPPPLANSGAFRRGRLLTVAVVAVTAAYLSWNAVHSFWFDHTMNALSAFCNFAFLGFLSWLALRGGSFTTGCLSVLYTLALVSFGNVIINFPLHIKLGSVFTFDSGSERYSENSLGALAAEIWAAFSFWVLLFSPDARLYRKARRQEVGEMEPPPVESPFCRR